MNDPYPTAEEELKTMTKRLWDQVDITEKLAAEVKQWETEYQSLQTSNALLRAAICALIGDSETAVFRDDLQANHGKRIDFVPEPSGTIYWIRAVDEKPPTDPTPLPNE